LPAHPAWNPCSGEWVDSRSRPTGKPEASQRLTTGFRLSRGVEHPRPAHAESLAMGAATLRIVSRVPREELAARAGVQSEWSDRLVDLGILRPDIDGSFSMGDVYRARLMDDLERAGIPLDSMAQVLEQGEVSLSSFDLPVYERFSLLSDTTFREASEQHDVPLELLMVVREAIGSAEPGPDDLVREDELRILPLIELQIARGFRQAVIERWLRVYGESLRRIVETETEWWRTEIQTPQLESGLNVAEMLEVTNRWGEELNTLTEQALLAVYRAQQEHAWHENFIEDVESVLERAGLRARSDLPPAFCFLDITGYTRLTEERGDEAAAELAARMSSLVRQRAERHRGKVVRWLGDGVMFYFREPGPAVRAALEMMEDTAGEGLPPAHVGVHAGPFVARGGDYFGRTVNLASRIADYARPGELLVSQEVVDAADLPEVEFTEIGPVELKGVSSPLRLHAARRRV
jgi:class 3 adenylate cyclase